MQAPKGWRWVGEWECVRDENTDADGFSYANDIVKNHYNSSKMLKTVRRRKWVRTCVKDLNPVAASNIQ